MINRYYKIGSSIKSLIRAQSVGFQNLINSVQSFGNVQKISTKQDTSGNYKEIKIEF